MIVNLAKILFLRLTQRKVVLMVLFVTVILTISCSRQALVTTYYLLDYYPNAVNQNLLYEEPIPYRVQVVNFKIPRSFDSIRIIARFSSHQINYYRYSLWAVRPQIAAADLLVQHINAYGLFAKCQREFLEERPEYEITGEIFQIERFESEKYSAAHLKMNLELYDRENNDLLIRHAFDRENDIPTGNMSIFAKAISDIINEETEIFLEKVAMHFQEPDGDSLQVLD